MADKLHIKTAKPLTAGLPVSFQVAWMPEQMVHAGGKLRLIYDYRGTNRAESAGQTSDPTAINYVSCVLTTGIAPQLRAYSVAHSYKPPWSEEPECYTWLDILGPAVSLDCHVMEAAFLEQGLSPGETLTFHFGGGEAGYLLSRKSYVAYPFWAILDPVGDGHWEAAGQTSAQIEPAAPSRLVITLPSVTSVGEATPVHIQAFDPEFNPVDSDALLRQVSAAIPQLDPGQHMDCVRFTEPGKKRLTADHALPLVVQCNPALVLESSPEDRIFWGDFHGHANLCDGGVRSAEEYFAWGRDVMALDFCALTPHDFGLALSAPEPRWEELQATTNGFNVPGSFVTFVSWEASHIGLPSGQPVGHKNLVFRGDQAAFLNGSNYGTHRVRVDYDSYGELIDRLQDLDCLVIPHHPLNPVLPGGLGTNWNEFWPERERLVEMYSLWGNSEGMDTPGRTADAVEGTSVLAALMRGYRLGFVAGSDTHDGRPANPQEPWSAVTSAGLTAVFAPCLTREAVYEALWQRSCYGTTGARIILYTHVGGLPMGKTQRLSPSDPLIREREIRVCAMGTGEIESTEVIRNGQIVHTFVGNGRDDMEAAWIDSTPLPMIALADAAGRRFVFYYVRVRQRDGHWAWGSPVWFEME